MLHKAWNSKGEMPYRFPRSSVKFQGHTVQSITDFDPNWAFLDYRPVAAFESLRFALFNQCFILDLVTITCLIHMCKAMTYRLREHFAFISLHHVSHCFELSWPYRVYHLPKKGKFLTLHHKLICLKHCQKMFILFYVFSGHYQPCINPVFPK